GVSSGLEIYRKDLQDQLQNLSLSEQDRTKYEKEIKDGDQTSLDRLRELFTKLQDQQAQEAIDKANLTLPRYMDARLKEFDSSHPNFQMLLEKLMGVVDKYRKLFDNAPNRKEVEELEKQAQEEMDAHIAEYKKTLAPAPGATDNGAPQAGNAGGKGKPAGDVGQGDKGVSSGLEIYRKDLQDQLQNLSLSEQDRTKYEKEIKDGDQTSLDRLRELFTKLQDQQAQEAIDKANLTLPRYMDARLKEFDSSHPNFQMLLEKLMGVVDKYRKLFDNAPNRKEVEELEKQAQEEMDAHIAEYKKTLAPAPGATDNGAPQAGNAGGKGKPAGDVGQGDKGKPDAGAGKGDAGKQAGDAGKPSPRNQTFTGTVGSVNVTVLFDKPVNAEKVTVKEITEKDLVDRISRQAGGGSIRLFDLSLTRGGKETHVNEERTVRLALEGLGENVQVYHVKPDGQLELLESKVEDGHVIFRINHFSLFAIKTMSTKSNQETPSNQATPSTQAKSTPKETTKDATSKKTLPNTGTADSTALLAAAASTAILGLGLAGRRRKED
ncbi:LPXTG cell wall anchor domain-containing protein, partial [Streptococcus pneumoniae]|nr:LPXTG cell wall anchor domain-containing protein [Streptococcus pneumoniae]MDS3451677.1 LPXTG cell wall anchor domain-containing protein [Streptococcus pneumoniae]MDS3752115.1 LPXTG cell wall anchor domain-containing protein [Streptococcus pneumoniae]MDS6090296.1 LPXTG cell wall anchor domain-containing protein [Streptococcus pneumoniae]MDS8677553.1 LPXTG cell wall anchor domain-containing protein [Streptococcus pneumoniae]